MVPTGSACVRPLTDGVPDEVVRAGFSLGMEMRRVSESDNACTARSRRRQLRSGSILLELIVTIPVLFLGTLAVFEFALLGLALQLVSTAAIEGVRSGALVGGSTSSVQATVEQILGVQGSRWRMGRRCESRGSHWSARQRHLATARSPRSRSPARGRHVGRERGTGDGGREGADREQPPVPNWLNGMGFNLGDRVIHHSALLTIE